VGDTELRIRRGRWVHSQVAEAEVPKSVTSWSPYFGGGKSNNTTYGRGSSETGCGGFGQIEFDGSEGSWTSQSLQSPVKVRGNDAAAAPLCRRGLGIDSSATSPRGTPPVHVAGGNGYGA